MRILFIADQHYLLRKRGVKKEWLSNRIDEFHHEIYHIVTGSHTLVKEQVDIIILGGDLFDKAPTIAELGLFLEFLNMCRNLKVPVYMIAGNHEATTKYESFLESLCPLESNLFSLNLDQKQIQLDDVYITFMSYAEVKRQVDPVQPVANCKNIMISHVCGDLPPHVTEEYPIGNFDGYDLTLLGDLHHYHKSLTGKNAWYPGSPYSITFSQAAETNKYGVFIIDTDQEDWTIPKFIPLDLPQLITKRCKPDEIKALKSTIKDSVHCYKIEAEGTPEEMASVVDKDIVKKSIVTNEATLNLFNKTEEEELQLVLEYMGVQNIDGVIKLNATINT